MTEVDIPSLDGTTFKAIAAYPPGEHGEGLILVRGLFASDEEVQELANSYAAQGFVTIAPNLFHKQQKMENATCVREPDWEEASRLYKNFDVEAGVRDLLSTLAHMRRMPSCGGKVGVVGYCVGCRMAYLLAARSDIDAAVGYYGVGLETMLDEMFDIRCPFMLHLAENDKLLPTSARERIARSAARNKKVEIVLYPSVEHSFARPSSMTFNPEQALIADHRTEQFLKKHLQA